MIAWLVQPPILMVWGVLSLLLAVTLGNVIKRRNERG